MAASTTTLAASANPSNFGQSVTLTATVSPSSAGGLVTFYEGQTILGVRTLSNGHATLTTSLLQQGAQACSGLTTVATPVTRRAPRSRRPKRSARHPLTPMDSSPPATMTASGHVIADFNGDGKADLADYTYNNTVSIYLGNGNGTFQGATTYTVPFTPNALVVGDFNGDGVADLAVAGSGGETSVLLGNGNGTFKPPVTTAGSSWSSVATADFNLDANNDLVVMDSSGNITVLLGRGDENLPISRHLQYWNHFGYGGRRLQRGWQG